MVIKELVQGILIDYEGKKFTRKMVQAATTRIVAAMTMLRHDVAVTNEEQLKDAVAASPAPVTVPIVPVADVPATPKDTPPVAVNAEKKADVVATPAVVEVGERKIIVSEPPKKPERNKVIVALPIGSLGTSLDPKTGATVQEDVGVFVAKSE